MAETNAHTEAPGGHSGFPPFQSEHFFSQLVWLGLSFALLYVLMARVALPRIGSIIAARSKHIAEDLKAAERFKEQADAAHATYAKALADARNRAQGIANATREQQARSAEETNKRLESQLHDRLVTAEQSIATTRTAAMANVGSIAADSAAAIVERLVGKAPTTQEVAAAVGEVLKR